MGFCAPSNKSGTGCRSCLPNWQLETMFVAIKISIGFPSLWSNRTLHKAYKHLTTTASTLTTKQSTPNQRVGFYSEFCISKREHCLFGERFFLFYSYLEILRRCCVQPRILLGNTQHVCEQMSVAQSAAPDKCEDLTGRINHKTCNMKSCTI